MPEVRHDPESYPTRTETAAHRQRKPKAGGRALSIDSSPRDSDLISLYRRDLSVYEMLETADRLLDDAQTLMAEAVGRGTDAHCLLLEARNRLFEAARTYGRELDQASRPDLHRMLARREALKQRGRGK